jgi:hypothetical protein
MRTVLIAHHNTAYAEQLADELRGWGYHVIDCPGPLPPVARCIRCDKGYCPLSEGADLMIYDPHLTARDEAGVAHNLAIESATAHPDVPMLLAWSPDALPDNGTLREIRSVAPWVHVAAHTPEALRRQLHDLINASVTSAIAWGG